MAHAEGTQSIPASLLEKYRGALREQDPSGKAYKRYPYRMPKFQGMGSNLPTKMLLQRQRFKSAVDRFNKVDAAERARWFEAEPPYNSLLWYYNYFILSSLNGVLGAIVQGAAVIRNIINVNGTVPTDGTTLTLSSSVDPSKCVVMLWGAGYNFSEAQVGDYPYAWAWPVYPVWSNLSSGSIAVGWPIAPAGGAVVACQVIEYI